MRDEGRLAQKGFVTTKVGSETRLIDAIWGPATPIGRAGDEVWGRNLHHISLCVKPQRLAFCFINTDDTVLMVYLDKVEA